MIRAFSAIFIIHALTHGIDINITGRAVDINGNPVEGVDVRLLLIGSSAVTDENGYFAIQDTGVVSLNSVGAGKGGRRLNVHYSATSEMLSFTIPGPKHEVSIWLYNSEGKETGCVFKGVLERGTYYINPFTTMQTPPGVSISFIRIRSGNESYVLKALRINNFGTVSPLLKSTKVSALPKRTAVIDTLRFSKQGYVTADTSLESPVVDVGSVIMLKYPTCDILTPPEGTAFDFGDTVSVSVAATDEDGNVDVVVFYIDGQYQSEDAFPPYTFAWNTVRNSIGNHVLKAAAKDNDGAVKSDSIVLEIRCDSTRIFSYSVVNTYPHDPAAFTQGLVYENGVFYEGTGLYGQSSIRRVNPETGDVLQRYDLTNSYFGEGITIWGERIIQLTWRENTGFVYDKGSFNLLGEFSYQTEGWGITHDGERLIMSDGSSSLYFLDPESFTETGSISVNDDNAPVSRLNELEFFYEKVFANIWQTDQIAMIDVKTGEVVGKIELSGLLTPQEYADADVLNGIAYDPETDRIFITGKLWPKLFEIRLVAAPR
jgi:glutamine cyclotransferase